MPSYALPKREQTSNQEEQVETKRAIEQLHDMTEQKMLIYQHSLLVDALAQSSENCEKILTKSNELLEQMKLNLQTDNKQNWQLIQELDNSVLKMENVNNLLNKNIQTTITELTSDIRNATVTEVKESLDFINAELKQETEAIRADAKNIHDFMVSELNDFEARKRRFFMFDGAKNFFFWFSQVVGIFSFGLLVYFVFFKA